MAVAVMGANAAIATAFVMLARCNRIRTMPAFLFHWHLSRARGS